MRPLNSSMRSLSRPRLTSSALGVLTAFGITNLWPVADILASGWSLWLAVRNGARPPLWAVVLAAAVAATAATGTLPFTTCIVAVRILALAIVFSHVREHAWEPRALIAGLVAGLLPQTIVLAITGFNEFRPNGLSVNASQTGTAGMALYTLGPLTGAPSLASLATTAVTVGSSGARQALLGLWMWAALRRSCRTSASAVVITAAFVAFAFTQTGTLGLDGLGPRIGLRLELLKAASGPVGHLATWVEKRLPPSWAAPVYNPAARLEDQWPRRYILNQYAAPPDPPPPPDPPAYHPPEIRWLGYGAGGYVEGTGLARPHNIYALIVFDLGVLAVVPAVLTARALWRRRIPLALTLVLAVQFLGTEEWTGRPEGAWMLAALFAWHVRSGQEEKDGKGRKAGEHDEGDERHRLHLAPPAVTDRTKPCGDYCPGDHRPPEQRRERG